MFSVRNDDPFVIFQILQDRARKSCGDNGTIDLSRGDPGFGFVPSIRSRLFGSLILFLDSILNVSPENRFLRFMEKDQESIAAFLEQAIQKNYSTARAEELLSLLREFLDAVKSAASEEGKAWTDFDSYRALFSFCAMSGGSYLRPEGQELTRIVLASWHRKEQGVTISSEDLILTNGASHAIGSLFKALGEEGCNYLTAGDTVAIASPVYAPYNRILEERNLYTLSFSIHPLTGKIDLSRFQKRAVHEGSKPPKVLFLIDPNNPTGFSLPEQELMKLAAIAREQHMLVITDEVYRSFFPVKRGMLALAPERTICISARSKIERATGLRLGEIVILPEGGKEIASILGLPNAQAFRRLLLHAKAPGRAGGEFQHTTFVPGPSQLLGMAAVVLGEGERTTYLRDLAENRAVFAAELGLRHEGNLYYVIFDLNALHGSQTNTLSIEEKLLALADAGVVYIPAYRFFAEEERSAPGILTSVRASIVNTTPERLKEAARRTKEVLCS